jgi:hypothetical protein
MRVSVGAEACAGHGLEVGQRVKLKARLVGLVADADHHIVRRLPAPHTYSQDPLFWHTECIQNQVIEVSE